MNPSGAHTPTPKTNERRNRENAQRQGVWNDGVDHGSARPPEPTAPQREFERSTQQPTTGVGPDGETLPQAEKRIADKKVNDQKMMQQFTTQGFVKSLMKMKTPTYSRVPSQEDANTFGPPAPATQQRSIDSLGQGSLPNNSGGMQNAAPSDENWYKKAAKERRDQPTERRTMYPGPISDLLKQYGVQ